MSRARKARKAPRRPPAGVTFKPLVGPPPKFEQLDLVPPSTGEGVQPKPVKAPPRPPAPVRTYRYMIRFPWDDPAPADHPAPPQGKEPSR